MLNVIDANDCWDAYLKSLKLLIDSKHLTARNVFMNIESTDDNYIVSLPHVVDDLPWYLRVNSDVVEGELGVGVGLDVRYSQKRLGRVKGHGAYDWGYRDETGRPNPFLNLILEEDEIFPNIGRIGGNGQLHYVKDLLKIDPTSDKGIVQLWEWKRDLLEYTRRKYHSPRIVGEETWSDSQHQRIPCPVSWHFVVTPQGVENSVYSRSLVWNEHIHDDIFRFSEPSRWIGGNLGKKSGSLVMTINKLWTRDFESDNRERLTDLYDFWTSNDPIKSYYKAYHTETVDSETFLRDWELKELAEQDYRLGAFYEGDKKLEQIKSPYYKDWVRVMRVAEMTIAHQVLGKMFRRGLHSRATKNALGYIEEKGLLNAVNEIEGVFKVQTVQWVINYLLRSRYDTEDYKQYLELLPDEIQQLTLLSSLNRVKQPVVEEILPLIDKKYVKLSPEYRGEVITNKSIPVRTLEGENEEVRKPIQLKEKPKFLVVDPYGGDRVNRKHPAFIKELAKKKEINFCYFPLEPFHYREKKRHATENAMRACAESLIPISIETRSEVPEWAVDLLTRHKYSEIRIHLNTLDPKKWELLYKNSAEPEELLNSIIRCFNGGVYTILKIAPIVPGVITPYDVFKVVDTTQNFIEKIEVCFANFTKEDFEKLNDNLLEKREIDVREYYEEADGRFFVKEFYRKEFLSKLYGFTKGLNIDLKIINEVSVKDGQVVGLLNIEE